MKAHSVGFSFQNFEFFTESAMLSASQFMTNSNKDTSAGCEVCFSKTNLGVTVRGFVKTKKGASYGLPRRRHHGLHTRIPYLEGTLPISLKNKDTKTLERRDGVVG
jgi:hypothetical protein